MSESEKKQMLSAMFGEDFEQSFKSESAKAKSFDRALIREKLTEKLASFEQNIKLHVV